jgi:hypothetical protein
MAELAQMKRNLIKIGMMVTGIRCQLILDSVQLRARWIKKQVEDCVNTYTPIPTTYPYPAPARHDSTTPTSRTPNQRGPERRVTVRAVVPARPN